MSAVIITIFRISTFVSILFTTAIINAQWWNNDNSGNKKSEPDTSDYLPLYYKGALDYNLMIAASKGYSSEIERLVGKGADIDAKTNEGATPLVFAIAGNKINAVEALLKYDPDLNTITSSYETPLLIAVKNRSFTIAEVLIRAGADVNYSDRYGATPLHYASILGYPEITDMLLYYDAPIDKKSSDGSTPLLASIWAGYSDVADLLIQNGANLEAEDNEGFTPFLMAAYFGDTLIMDILHRKNVNIYAINKSRHNALTLSIAAGQANATSYLLRKGDKWDSSGADSSVTVNPVNPFSVASKYHRKDIIRILEKSNLKGKLRYEIDQMEIKASSRVCLNDYFTGLSIAFKEPYLNGGIIAGCDMKLWYTRVLRKESDHWSGFWSDGKLFYQYMDKGSVVYAGLFKNFMLISNPFRSSLEFSTSLSAGYTFGNKLKGTNIAPENKFVALPAVSFVWIKNNLSLSIGLEYLKTEFYHTGPVWLRIGASYNIFFNNIRVREKIIKWYR